MSDFTNTADAGGVLTGIELDDEIDFFNSGDEGSITIVNDTGWGDDWGEDWGGGTQHVVVTSGATPWTNVDEP